MKKLAPCPFCGKVETATFPTVSVMQDGIWDVTHFCHTNPVRKIGEIEDMEVCITCYGKTEDEAINRWNKRFAKEDAECTN